MTTSTSNSSPSVTLAWWFPNLPERENLLPALAVQLPKDKLELDVEEYQAFLVDRIQELAEKESPQRLQELAEDAGLLGSDEIGAQVVEQSLPVLEVLATLPGKGYPRLKAHNLVESAEEMDLEELLGDLT
jgi:hypothetical protein